MPDYLQCSQLLLQMRELGWICGNRRSWIIKLINFRPSPKVRSGKHHKKSAFLLFMNIHSSHSSERSNHSIVANVINPNSKNKRPPIKFTCLSEMWLLSIFPHRIANAEQIACAKITETSTIQGLCLAERAIVVN